VHNESTHYKCQHYSKEYNHLLYDGVAFLLNDRFNVDELQRIVCNSIFIIIVLSILGSLYYAYHRYVILLTLSNSLFDLFFGNLEADFVVECLVLGRECYAFDVITPKTALRCSFDSVVVV
jgi:hypothetical protein